MKEQYEFCAKFGFDEKKRELRLSLLGFSESDHSLANALHDRIIHSNSKEIIDSFYDRLLEYPGFMEIIGNTQKLANLKSTQQAYLNSLGRDFSTPEYFEERLRIGYAHFKIGLEPDLYQCAYYIMEKNIIKIINQQISDITEREALTDFLLKITTLDMSLAIETYHMSEIFKLNAMLESMHGRAVKMQKRAETDALTSVLRREHLLEVLKKVIVDAGQDSSDLCIIMADLDNFKMINDQHGHLTGDAVLRGVSSRIQSALRADDIVGRYGGEEFLFILQNTSLLVANEIAERVCNRVNSTDIHADGKNIPITLSQGIAVFQKGDDMEGLINRADHAMYTAKHAGRNCVKIYESTQSS